MQNLQQRAEAALANAVTVTRVLGGQTYWWTGTLWSHREQDAVLVTRAEARKIAAQ